MTSILKEIIAEYGSGEKCKIRDPEKVEKVLQGLVKGGADQLQVITDFDFTLTRFHKDGEKCTSCYGMVDNSPLMSDEYREKANALREKYYPLEINPEISTEDKIPHMVTWYTGCENLLIEYQLTRPKIKEIVKTGRALLRDSAREVLSLLNDHKVPCLIFSAGLGDVIEEVLQRESASFPNLKVVSNFMEFNDKGECVNFKEPFIHMFNKNETALDNPQFFKELSHRNNALVLGDSLGDVHMDKGLQNPDSILKIGFLNDKINERLESFIQNFDVVLLDDQTFNFVSLILSKIVASQGNGKAVP